MLYLDPLIKLTLWCAIAVVFFIIGPWELGVWFLLFAFLQIGHLYQNRKTGTTVRDRRHLRRMLREVRDSQPDFNFDERGITTAVDGQDPVLYRWNEVTKIDLLSFKDYPLGGSALYLLFYGPENKTQVVPYDQAPLDMLQEMQRLPGFDIDDAMRPLESLSGNHRVTCWERPSI